MTNIQRIEQEISNLSSHELAEFRSWYEKFDAEVWDKQLESDIKSGSLESLAKDAIDDYNKGKCKKL